MVERDLDSSSFQPRDSFQRPLVVLKLRFARVVHVKKTALASYLEYGIAVTSKLCVMGQFDRFVEGGRFANDRLQTLVCTVMFASDLHHSWRS
jgi:hypothetical protein